MAKMDYNGYRQNQDAIRLLATPAMTAALAGVGDGQTGSGTVVVSLTQAAYDALATKDPAVLYVII